MTAADAAARWDAVMMNNYGTPPLALVRGEGCRRLGRRRPSATSTCSAASRSTRSATPTRRSSRPSPTQVATLGHVSNLFVAEPPVALAERLLGLLGRPARAGCSSATPAPRPTRRRSSSSRRTGRTHVVATEGGFHGRTMGALALTGQPAKARRRSAAARRGHPRAVRRRRRAAPRRSTDRDRRWSSSSRSRARTAWSSPPPGYLAAARRDRPPHGALLVARRGADRHRPDRRTGSPTRPRASSRTWSRWPRASAAGCRSAPASASARPAELLGPGQHGTTFGGNPVCLRRRARRARHDRARRPAGPRQARSASGSPPGIEALGHPLVDRGPRRRAAARRSC